MAINVKTNDVYDALLTITSDNQGVTGQTPTTVIQRFSDGYYWNGSSWQSATATNNMIEIDSSTRAGWYTTDNITNGSIEDNYLIAYKNSGTYALDTYEQIKVNLDFASEIDAEHGTALTTTPSGSTTSIQKMLNFLYQALRNKSVATGSLVTVTDSSDNVISKAVVAKTSGQVTRSGFVNP